MFLQNFLLHPPELNLQVVAPNFFQRNEDLIYYQKILLFYWQKSGLIEGSVLLPILNYRNKMCRLDHWAQAVR